MFDRAAFLALRIRQKFAHLPEIFALIDRRGDLRILDDMFFARRFKEREQSRGKPLPALRTQFEQHVPQVLSRKNFARVKMREDKIQADARDKLEARDFATRHVAGNIEQGERRTGRGKADKCGFDRAGSWIKL